MGGRLAVALLAGLIGTAGAAATGEGENASARSINPSDIEHTYTRGHFVPDFEPPAPGTYELPVIATVEDYAVLDTAGTERDLLALKDGRMAIVAFVYNSCAEATGCPLAEAVLQRLDRRLAADPELAEQVRLMSISFDPERDTPARMGQVREHYAPQTDWLFLTTADERALQPILDDFGQSVSKLRWEDGTWSGLFRHVLKVFLLDEDNRVRNIYSSGFINPDLVLNDIVTLTLEESDGDTGPSGQAPQTNTERSDAHS